MATVEQTSAEQTVHLAAATTALAAGKQPGLLGRLGGWQLTQQLAEGTMNRLYLAKPATADESQPAAYVVKLLRNEWWRDVRAIDRQRREAWIGSRVSHPNVVPVLSAAIDQPPFYLVMPRLAGSSLARLLSEGYEPPLATALWIIRQAAEGLSAVVEQTGMLHSDVKPANLMVASTGHTTVIDFGFAHSTSEAASWADRPVLGTLNYIAPERVTSTLASDARSDIYSLGVLLYEMLTGHLPLESDDPGELARLHREVKPTCIRQVRPAVPSAVAGLVHAMLSKNPLRRPSSYRELVERLVRLEIDCFATL